MNVGVANMINPAGVLVEPNATTIQSAMSYGHSSLQCSEVDPFSFIANRDFANAFTPELTAVIVNGPSPTSWPIAAYTYTLIRRSGFVDCEKASIAKPSRSLAHSLVLVCTPTHILRHRLC